MLLLCIVLLLMAAVMPALQQFGTPVIGGTCKLNTPDVHIGGKQTQFFLRCEPNAESAPGEGVWVVKSRHASSTAAKIPAAAVVSQREYENNEQKVARTKEIANYVCDLISDAVEHGYCSASEHCLQPVYTDRTAFLQCDPTTRRWMKKHCQSGFNFDFERQACIAHTAKMAHHFRQFPSYGCPGTIGPMPKVMPTQPLSSAPSTSSNLRVGTNATTSIISTTADRIRIARLEHKFEKKISSLPTTTIPSIPMVQLNNNNPNDKLNALMMDDDGVIDHQKQRRAPYPSISSVCPTGAPALGPCAPSFCVAPLQCAGGLCCAPPAAPVMPPQPPPIAYACPGGLPALGPCIGGRCAAPAAICASPANVCCAQAAVPTAIPATVCPDGTQAAGACVNGQCGAGFTCNQGLCCTNTSQTPRCLDGSQSIGACIQGKCGTGYTCTTGNICCPSQLNLCPPGQTSVGQAVNGRCPVGYTNFNGQCCGPQSAQSQISCSREDSFGTCDNNQQCPEPGYACDVEKNWCCPQVIGDAIGPCIQGEGGNRLCPEGYACVGEGEGQCFRLDTGTCPPEEQSGPCAPDGSCPPGYECIEGFCCQTDAGRVNPTLKMLQHRRRRHTVASTFLRMVNYERKERQHSTAAESIKND